MEQLTPGPTVDLILLQRLNGAYLAQVGANIPHGQALAALAAEDREEHGFGTIAMLVPSGDAILAVRQELARARERHAPLNSAHEAYAVILEELDEFFAEVRKRAERRDPAAMRRELVQIAAMAIRAVEDLAL